MSGKRAQQRPVGEQERQQILDLCRAGGSCREVAAQVGRSSSTISKLAREAGVPFARVEQTEAATRARTATLAERRTLAAEGLLDDLADGRARLADSESPRDFRDTAAALQALAVAHAKLTEVGRGEPNNSIAEGTSLIGDLARGLSAIVAGLPPEEPSGE